MKVAEDDVSLCVLSGFSSYRMQKVYTENHSGISARQRDSKVSMTDLVKVADKSEALAPTYPPMRNSDLRSSG